MVPAERVAERLIAMNDAARHRNAVGVGFDSPIEAWAHATKSTFRPPQS